MWCQKNEFNVSIVVQGTISISNEEIQNVVGAEVEGLPHSSGKTERKREEWRRNMLPLLFFVILLRQ